MKDDKAIATNRYDAVTANVYSQTRRWTGAVPPHVVRVASLAPSSRLLDLACGTGNFMTAIHQLCSCRCTGIDLSPDMLAQAAGRVKDAVLVQGNVAHLPFAENSFDCVAGAMFLHHLTAEEAAACIRESFRVLNAGVTAIVTMSHEQIRSGRLGRFFPEVLQIDLKRFPPVEDVIQWFRHAGYCHVQADDISDDSRRRTDGEFLQAVRRKFVSTLAMIDEDAFDGGVSRIEAAMRGGPLPEDPRRVTVVWGKKT